MKKISILGRYNDVSGKQPLFQSDIGISVKILIWDPVTRKWQPLTDFNAAWQH